MAIMSPREPLSPSFELFVTDIETLAVSHTGQAKETVLAAFGRPFLDPFDRVLLDRALLRVHEARNDGERAVGRVMLASALSMVERRAQKAAS